MRPWNCGHGGSTGGSASSVTYDSEYGIDFLRNGRKILTDEKTLFTWETSKQRDIP